MHCFALVPLLAFVNMGINAATIHHDRHTPMPIAHMKTMRQVHNADFSKHSVSSSGSLPGNSEASDNHSGHKRDMFLVLSGLGSNADAPAPDTDSQSEVSLEFRADDGVGANGAVTAVTAAPSDTFENVADKVPDGTALPPANPTSNVISPRSVLVNTPVKVPRDITANAPLAVSPAAPAIPTTTQLPTKRDQHNSAVLRARQVPAPPAPPAPPAAPNVPALPVPAPAVPAPPAVLDTRQVPAPPAAPAPPSAPNVPALPVGLPVPAPATPAAPAGRR